MAVTDGRIGPPGRINHYIVPASAATVHWGYFSRSLKPVLSVDSADFVTIETLTHHAYDDHPRMIEGDPGAESVFLWTKHTKNVDLRGAGPMDASIHGRGAGEGFGVHICTGPIFVRDAEPGDVLEVRIIDVRPRGCHNPAFEGRAFGSNAAAWWGFHYNDLLTEPKPREVITIYEIDAAGDRNWARAVYNYRWVPQTEHSDEARPLRGRHYATAGAQVFYCPPISKRQTCPTRCLKDRRSDTL
jgi:Acetamidase/Formamidase family